MFRGMKGFLRDIEDFGENTKRGAQAAVKREASNWFGEVVSLTPHDTYFAQSMWKYTVNRKPSGGSIKHPGGNYYTPARTPTFYNFDVGDILYIYNNVEYIQALEDGWSSQAPANFANNSARRADRRLQRALNRL